MNEKQINRLYQEVVKQRNMEIFRPWLTVDAKTKYDIVYMDLKGDNQEIDKYLRGFY